MNVNFITVLFRRNVNLIVYYLPSQHIFKAPTTVVKFPVAPAENPATTLRYLFKYFAVKIKAVGLWFVF